MITLPEVIKSGQTIEYVTKSLKASQVHIKAIARVTKITKNVTKVIKSIASPLKTLQKSLKASQMHYKSH
jgi:hypothetical protein